MTTVQDDTQIESEIAFELTQIETEHGSYSLADIREIDDLAARAAAAAAVARVAEQMSDLYRSTRDMAGLILIQPYQAAQRPYDDAMEKIDAALEAGKIDAATAHRRRDAAKAKRRERMENVVYKPVHVYRDTIGVSRGLFVRMQHRATQQLPTAREFLQDMSGSPDVDDVIDNAHALGRDDMAAVAAVSVLNREKCKLYDAIADGVRTIRDDAVTMLLNGNPKVGRAPLSNADVARLTKLTTARVAQMRYGTR